jgi:Ser/Thr protein kinase RdoA (MazF antagonist)
MKDLRNIATRFNIQGNVSDIRPLGNGLINDTFLVSTMEPDSPDYVLQRINHHIFQDVALLQDNIEKVTRHIRGKLQVAGEDDIDRKVMTFITTQDGKTYHFDSESYWRMSLFIPRTQTINVVNESTAMSAGLAFGHFEAMLADMPEKLGEPIPHFHDIELRVKQLEDAMHDNKVGRLSQVKDMCQNILEVSPSMSAATEWLRRGFLPTRICHCDPKVNNILFNEQGEVLCVIDLDTVMPSHIYSDYGDFLRTAANFTAEDDADLSKVGFNMQIFKAFTQGYLQSTQSFLTDAEIAKMPYGAALFPYMQCVRFLADYLNGDTYYKTAYPEHNLVRAKNQLKLYQDVEAHADEMNGFIEEFLP